MHQSPVNLARSGGALAAAALVLVAAATFANADIRPEERAEQLLDHLFAHARSSQMKLENDVIPFEPQGPQQEPKHRELVALDIGISSRDCCSNNIDIMLDDMMELKLVVERIGERYRRDGDEEAIKAVRFLAQQFKNLDHAMAMWFQAADKDFGLITLKGVNAGISDVRIALKNLRECCTDTPTPEIEDR